MDKDWNFLPKSTDSFDNSNTKSIETFFYKNKFGLLIKSSNFNLDLLRPVEPKNLDLIASSKNLEFFYIKNIDTVFSIDLKYQTTDTQVINCYTFSTVTLGNCNDAVLSIRNTKDKYKRLNGALLMIDGENQEIRLNFFKGLKNLLIDEIHIYSSISRNSFDWITPLEEIKSGFIYELTFNNQKVGDLVQVVAFDQGRNAARVYKPSTFALYPKLETHPIARIHSNSKALPGNSGGAVVDQYGMLVGVLASGDHRISEIIPATNINKVFGAIGAPYKEAFSQIGGFIRRCADALHTSASIIKNPPIFKLFKANNKVFKLES